MACTCTWSQFAHSYLRLSCCQRLLRKETIDLFLSAQLLLFPFEAACTLKVYRVFFSILASGLVPRAWGRATRPNYIGIPRSINFFARVIVLSLSWRHCWPATPQIAIDFHFLDWLEAGVPSGNTRYDPKKRVSQAVHIHSLECWKSMSQHNILRYRVNCILLYWRVQVRNAFWYIVWHSIVWFTIHNII